VVSGAGTGAGPALQAPGGIVEDVDGTLLVVDLSLPGLVRIDPMTGDRATVSAGGIGNGVAFSAPLAVTLVDSASLNGRIATDFSCRLILADSTLDADSVAPALWRFADLRGARINGLENTPLSTAEAPVDFSGILINGTNLAGAKLDGATFDCVAVTNVAVTSCEIDAPAGTVCSCLQSTNLESATLRGASMASAQMQGITLSRANLDGADLSGAQMQGLSDLNGNLIAFTDISGAFMRNVDLTGANLSSVTANNFNFFSVPNALGRSTADATGADFTNASLAGAYLAGAVFEGLMTGQSANFQRTVLAGIDFTDADLQANQVVQKPTDFSQALMHGPIFDNANVESGIFTGTYWDTMVFDDMALVVELPDANLKFAGFWHDPNESLCVAATYGFQETPATDGSNKCPDGSLGPCDFTETPSDDPPFPFATCPIDDVTDPASSCFDLPNSQTDCTMADQCWTNPDLPC
jgi:uncharacterized protein YjbI with pentapeptide repeats